MDEQNNLHEYRTGRTRPKKSHSGLIAFFLIAAIFLGGIVSALGLLNIRLFKRLEEPDNPLSFTPETNATAPQNTTSDSSVNLVPSPPSAENIPQTGGLSLQAIYEQAIPSVVSISCTLKNGTSSGTGVVLTQNGYLLTNNHVIDGAVSITAGFTDGRELPATVVGKDVISDLAVLQVSATDLIPAIFGDSSVLRVGDAVVAIGDPLGSALRGTMTDGIVSAINRNIETDGRTMTLIQTNAALNAGNSGGPLLNCYGQVIGINTMKIGDYTNGSSVEGLGFAIPSVTVKEIVDQLLDVGYVAGRPTLKMEFQELSLHYQILYNLPKGLYISQVDADSSAKALGIVPGDVLISFNGTPVSRIDALQSLLYAHQAGEQVEIVIYRGGRQYQLMLTIDQAQ